ncbi:hypothetical protein F511_41738 [Dorcoceras hygrometricum]|uniref:Uncharacterized protein n=1 Tax=Dorcoceras hygrometricum TaxID=472368 RepID=A0A2Z7AMB0_9LAMI|nr:hypothetical protein F511_41738 [Dorcoceras hygrometricum]
MAVASLPEIRRTAAAANTRRAAQAARLPRHARHGCAMHGATSAPPCATLAHGGRPARDNACWPSRGGARWRCRMRRHRQLISKIEIYAIQAVICIEGSEPELYYHCWRQWRIRIPFPEGATEVKTAPEYAAVDRLIGSTTGIKTPSSAYTRRPDEFSTDGNSLARWPEQVRRRGGGAWVADGGAKSHSLKSSSYTQHVELSFRAGIMNPVLVVTLNGSRIQLAVGPQPLWLRNHNFGLAQRTMVKSLETSPHDPLGITDSACKNQLVMVSVHYGPYNTYIPIRSTTIDSIGYPRMKASGESSTTKHRLLMQRDLTQSRRLMTPSESENGSKVKELSKRIPTLPHSKEKKAGSNGKLPEKLTVNSALGFENRERSFLIRARDLFKNKHRQKQISQSTRAKQNQDPKTTSHKPTEKAGQKALKAGNTLQES